MRRAGAQPNVRVLVVQSTAGGLPFVEAIVSLIASQVTVRADDEFASGGNLADDDLILFSRSEWDDDALDTLRTLHGAASGAPILVLSGPCDAASRVGALASGADDFLNVPFAVEEFVARAHALRRRSGRLRYGPLRLDTAQRVALLEDRPLVLTGREFDILLALVRRGGDVATRAELEAGRDGGARAGSHGPTSSHAPPGARRSNWLDVHMNSIRQKLGKHAWLLETVRGTGYRLRPLTGRS